MGAVLIVLVLGAGTLGAVEIIKPDGVDFTRLAPLPAACAIVTLILWLVARWNAWWWQNPRLTAVGAMPLIVAVPTFFISIPVVLVSLAVGGAALRVRFVPTGSDESRRERGSDGARDRDHRFSRR